MSAGGHKFKPHAFTAWAVDKGCHNREHPEYAAARKRFTGGFSMTRDEALKLQGVAWETSGEIFPMGL